MRISILCLLKSSFSSGRWLDRQKRDPFTKLAHASELRARSAFKLMEINEKHRLFKKTDYVIDLGACPGGWSLVAKSFLTDPNSSLVSVDLLPINPIGGVHILTGDFRSAEIHQSISSFQQRKADVILSDILHNTTGHRLTDQSRSVEIVRSVLHFATYFLKPDGKLLCKVLRGGEDIVLIREVKVLFKDVNFIKPKASRTESSEIYILGTGFRNASNTNIVSSV